MSNINVIDIRMDELKQRMNLKDRLVTPKQTLMKRAASDLLRNAARIDTRPGSNLSRDMPALLRDKPSRKLMIAAIDWAELLQLEIHTHKREVLPSVALPLAHAAGLCNIKSPFMFAAAVNFLHEHWLYGDDLLAWYHTLEYRQ